METALKEQDKAICAYCGQEGLYGKEVVDTDYRDCAGHDTTILACKDINACFSRGGNHTRPQY